MRFLTFFLTILFAFFLISPSFVLAAPPESERMRLLKERFSEISAEEATLSAEEATPSAVVEIIKEPEEEEPDLTQPTKKETRLERLLKTQELTSFSPFNFLRHAVKGAVDKGVPPNTIVLILMFPLVASLVAAARHFVGIKGFGIFTPAVISVAFLATGIFLGVFLFVFILIAATVARILMRRFRIQYLPRMALLLWFVSMAILGVIIASPWLKYEALMNLGIFPILLLILLAETFIDVQITRSFSRAVSMTIETLILATTTFYLMNWEALQDFVLLNPEIFTFLVVILNVFVSKYAGLRLLELWRFRKVLKN